MSDLNYEKEYSDLMSNLQGMHKHNIQKTKSALKSLLIIPTIFLILLFMTNSSKTIFMVLWIASMFVIAAILIVVEYQDYSLRKMMTPTEAEEAAEAVVEEAEEAVEAVVEEATEAVEAEAAEEACAVSTED